MENYKDEQKMHSENYLKRGLDGKEMSSVAVG